MHINESIVAADVEERTPQNGKLLEEATDIGAGLVEFEMLELQREMPLFGSSIGLEPHRRARPSSDFIVRLTSDHAGHQSLLREKLGSQFTNFRNLQLGKAKSSATTLKAIDNRLNDFNLPHVPDTPPVGDGPLWPELLNAHQRLLDMPYRFYLSLTQKGCACAHCGANMLADSDIWWSRQVVKLNPPEYRFVERMLVAVMASALHELFAWVLGKEGAGLDGTIALAAPGAHPMGNWLRQVMEAHHVSTYEQLAMKVGTREQPFDERRIGKWACGDSLMPLKLGELLAQGVPATKRLIGRLYSARSLAMTTEFVIAAALGAESSREYAQSILEARLKVIYANLLASLTSERTGQAI